jgi:hypothetical protein
MGMYSTPIQDVIDRLTYHTLAAQIPARMLDGTKLESVPRSSVEGLADLPGVRLLIPTVESEYFPGGRTGQEQGTIKMLLVIGVKRDDGANALATLLKQVETVLDALNIDATGQFSPSIKGTLKPFSWKIENTYPVDNSLNAQVSVSLEPRPVPLGQRRS